MIRKEILNKVASLHRGLYFTRNSSSKLDIKKLEEESAPVEVIEDESAIREEEIEKKRNKSRLKEHHRNVLLDKNPYPEPAFWHHGTLEYLRKMYGRYGQASGVNPSICWPVKQELEEVQDYENVKYPFTIPQMVAEAKEKRRQKEEEIRLRQEDIAKKVEKLEEWTKDLHYRIGKKESEAKAAKDRKERLIEEVRRHFGYTVDPRDDKFKELLAKKEKEDKKLMKEARRKAKEESMVKKLLKKKNVKAVGEKETADDVADEKEEKR